MELFLSLIPYAPHILSGLSFLGVVLVYRKMVLKTNLLKQALNNMINSTARNEEFAKINAISITEAKSTLVSLKHITEANSKILIRMEAKCTELEDALEDALEDNAMCDDINILKKKAKIAESNFNEINKAVAKLEGKIEMLNASTKTHDLDPEKYKETGCTMEEYSEIVDMAKERDVESKRIISSMSNKEKQEMIKRKQAILNKNQGLQAEEKKPKKIRKQNPKKIRKQNPPLNKKELGKKNNTQKQRLKSRGENK